MKISKSLFNLLSLFNSNWEQNRNSLCLELSDEQISNIEIHPLRGELTNLVSGKGASLPFLRVRILFGVHWHRIICCSTKRLISCSPGYFLAMDGRKVATDIRLLTPLETPFNMPYRKFRQTTIFAGDVHLSSIL